MIPGRETEIIDSGKVLKLACHRSRWDRERLTQSDQDGTAALHKC